MKHLNYHSIVISGQVATGTSTLAINLKNILGWKYINAGDIQRNYDKKHKFKGYEHGALIRPDEHENKIDQMTINMLKNKTHLIYEAWLGGYMTHKLPGILRVLLICSDDAVRIDRITNRDKLTIQEAKKFLKIREVENLAKWQKLYGNHDFWDPKYFNLVIDTYSSGAMETVGKVLDKLGYSNLKK